MNGDYLTLGTVLGKDLFAEKDVSKTKKVKKLRRPINFSKYFPLAEAVADIAN